MVSDFPKITGIVRKPNDDHVLACALAASAQYLVTRDPDLLALGTYKQVQMVLPEEFIQVIRQQFPPPGKT